jgi:hypothetical protein
MPLSRRSLLALAALTATATACGTPPTEAGDAGGTRPQPLEALPRQLTAAERGAVAAAGDFSFALFREVTRRKAAENVFVPRRTSSSRR